MAEKRCLRAEPQVERVSGKLVRALGCPMGSTAGQPGQLQARLTAEGSPGLRSPGHSLPVGLNPCEQRPTGQRGLPAALQALMNNHGPWILP